MSHDPHDTADHIRLPDAPAEQRAVLDAGGVACWAEDVIIGTYQPGEPDRYPLFLGRRVYQGSSGRVYPMPMIDSVAAEKSPRAWRAIHLENQYVRLMLLPDIGGRIHIGYDKVADYDFFYRNNVIKPALVGLAGPWISGGVEFNWPQHHRPATFLPVETRIEREDDGAVVVWHSDLDPLSRMRGTHGIRLRPSASVIEAEVILHNRTDLPQTFLWWANVAARAHERYRSFFPDDVSFVADHARRAITAFPRADRPYYGVDYPALAAERPGSDRLDTYSNIPVPTSYMVTDTRGSFFGGYDDAVGAGFVHWADRAISPGKKQWTWGDGPVGHAWDAQLTDDDGPYVELMAGVYTDNQPDFSWLMPGETRRFSQYWYPIHGIGPAREATRDAAVSLGGAHGRARIGAIATQTYADVEVHVHVHGRDDIIWRTSLGPDAPAARELDVDPAGVHGIEVRAGDRVLVDWRRFDGHAGEPRVATAPPAPAGIASNDELYLTAVHVTQYRHPTRSPIPYLEEALRRDPGDSRATTALGEWHLRRGEYERARELLETAVRRETRRNLNPRDGESFYLLGLTLERLGDLQGADDCFAKAAWNAAWAGASGLARARIASRQGRIADALVLADAAGGIPEARRVRVLALRRAGDAADADALAHELLTRDPLDPGTAALTGALRVADPRTPIDVACEFARSGGFAEALEIAAAGEPAHGDRTGFTRTGPVVHYLRASWLEALGRSEEAEVEREVARATDAALAFPAGLDQYDALRLAHAADPGDPVAAGLLGMWLLDAGRTDDALGPLRHATVAGSTDPVHWRNLAIALVTARGDTDAADAALVRALQLRRDPRLVLERDVLARVRGLDSASRLSMLGENPDLVPTRDDLAIVYVELLLDTGQLNEAWEVISSRTFRPFEGGEGRVIAAYDRAVIARARAMLDIAPAEAIELLRSTEAVPAHLGEGRHPAVPQAERYVLLGDAQRRVGDEPSAQRSWRQACTRSPLAATPRPVDLHDYWIGVAHVRLGEHDEADNVWRSLEHRAEELRHAAGPPDYFATSLPELALFDTDTLSARRAAAALLQRRAAEGRALV